eukprot:CAMPEP_0204629752 /NCGR_PEP_ID=MMETSP0717-20131115/18846_1 /ASSEMBLY_ACC=CAM_ASM_000666 /TAXON_ID=230516 /ORGANISM="Chaetoceros curvisetus" /LENGTH=42 /DNA_ID= /DNA_START= /DNA_END= /DNA_ORIENTATION=
MTCAAMLCAFCHLAPRGFLPMAPSQVNVNWHPVVRVAPWKTT